MRKYDTVIFDLDGTLLNTIDDLMDAVNYTMREYGYCEYSVSDIKSFVGNGIKNLMIKATPDGEENEKFDEIFQCFKAYYGEHCQVKTAPYEGIMELISVLHDKGYKMAIVSNKVNSAVEELNKIYFDKYIGVAIGERDGIRKKPSPDSVFEAMKILDSKQENTLYVGDSEVDARTAINSGIDYVLVKWGFRDMDILGEFSPIAFIDKARELVEILE